MKRITGRRPSPATIVAFLAVVVALSGSAVGLPGKNRVDSGDIRNNTVNANGTKMRTTLVAWVSLANCPAFVTVKRRVFRSGSITRALVCSSSLPFSKRSRTMALNAFRASLPEMFMASGT